jgi:hypothetical protein
MGMHDLKIVLNMAEEPYLVYVSGELAMRNGGWRHNMQDPQCSPDWIQLIKKYKTFSGVEETYQFTQESYEKYRTYDERIPLHFDQFLPRELEIWSEKNQ